MFSEREISVGAGPACPPFRFAGGFGLFFLFVVLFGVLVVIVLVLGVEIGWVWFLFLGYWLLRLGGFGLGIFGVWKSRADTQVCPYGAMNSLEWVSCLSVFRERIGGGLSDTRKGNPRDIPNIIYLK